MKIKIIMMATLIAFTFSCGLMEKFGKKEEPAKEEQQKVEVVKPEPIKEGSVSQPAPEKAESAPATVTPPPQMVSVVASVVNIRSGPGMKNKVVTKVKKGDELELLGESGPWLNVKLSNGMEGWVYKALVR